MKVAVASTGYELDSDVSPIFGRSFAFIIANVEEGKIRDISPTETPQKSEIFGACEICDFAVQEAELPSTLKLEIFNNHAQNETGAGNTAAHFIVNQKVETLISGKLGPVAFHILKNAGIKIYKATSGSVEKNLKRFNEGKLEEITSLSGGFPV